MAYDEILQLFQSKPWKWYICKKCWHSYIYLSKVKLIFYLPEFQQFNGSCSLHIITYVRAKSLPYEYNKNEKTGQELFWAITFPLHNGINSWQENKVMELIIWCLRETNFTVKWPWISVFRAVYNYILLLTALSI